MITARTGKPGSASNEREPSQGLEDEILMSALQVQRERILAEAKFEIQKYEERPSYDENYIRNLKSQIDSRDWDLRRTLEGYMEASHAKDRLRQETADTERTPQEDRLRGFSRIWTYEEESWILCLWILEERFQKNQRTINNLLDKVRELQCEIIFFWKDFKDAESVHSGQLSHVSRYVLTKMSEKTCLAVPKLCRPILGKRRLHRETFLSPPAYPSSSHKRIPTPWDHPDAGRVFERTWRGQLVPKDGHGGKSAVRNPRFLRSSLSGSSFDSTLWKGAIYELWSWPSRNSFWQVPYSTNVFVLENKVQDGNVFFFFKFPYGGNVMDQSRGDDYFSGRFQIFAIHSGNYTFSWFWIIGRKNCIIPEQDHPEFLLQEEGPSGGTEGSESRLILSRKTDRWLDLRLLPGHWRQRFCARIRWLHFCCSSERQYEGIQYQMGRNVIVCETIPTWWYSGKSVQIENTRIWKIEDRIRVVQLGDSSEEVETWFSSIEDNGQEKYWARSEDEEFWGQKRENWIEHAGQESEGTMSRS